MPSLPRGHLRIYSPPGPVFRNSLAMRAFAVFSAVLKQRLLVLHENWLGTDRHRAILDGVRLSAEIKVIQILRPYRNVQRGAGPVRATLRRIPHCLDLEAS